MGNGVSRYCDDYVIVAESDMIESSMLKGTTVQQRLNASNAT